MSGALLNVLLHYVSGIFVFIKIVSIFLNGRETSSYSGLPCTIFGLVDVIRGHWSMANPRLTQFLGGNKLGVKVLAVSDTYIMFIEPTITLIPSRFSGCI